MVTAPVSGSSRWAVFPSPQIPRKKASPAHWAVASMLLANQGKSFRSSTPSWAQVQLFSTSPVSVLSREGFYTLENIIKGKGEILENTKVKAVIAADCYEYFASYPCEKVKCDCVSDVVPDCDGTSFTLTLGGESKRVRTKLLGAHAANNIGLCAQCAYEMGVSFDDICASIASLEFVEHRLQLIKSNGVNIIDDGYNANVKGAEAALEVLKTFGGSKIVVTPGLVELGILDREENAALGAKLVGFDNIILVGDTLVGYVKEGYISAGGDPEKLRTVPTLYAAEEEIKGIIKKGDAVLFLNDLPDVYA